VTLAWRRLATLSAILEDPRVVAEFAARERIMHFSPLVDLISGMLRSKAAAKQHRTDGRGRRPRQARRGYLRVRQESRAMADDAVVLKHFRQCFGLFVRALARSGKACLKGTPSSPFSHFSHPWYRPRSGDQRGAVSQALSPTKTSFNLPHSL
jgi:hypothetical protein